MRRQRTNLLCGTSYSTTLPDTHPNECYSVTAGVTRSADRSDSINTAGGRSPPDKPPTLLRHFLRTVVFEIIELLQAIIVIHVDWGLNIFAFFISLLALIPSIMLLVIPSDSCQDCSKCSFGVCGVCNLITLLLRSLGVLFLFFAMFWSYNTGVVITMLIVAIIGIVTANLPTTVFCFK